MMSMDTLQLAFDKHKTQSEAVRRGETRRLSDPIEITRRLDACQAQLRRATVSGIEIRGDRKNKLRFLYHPY